MRGFIYIIINIVNNKLYVGQTCEKPANRWNRHELCVRAIVNLTETSYKFLPVHQEIAKNPEDFLFTVLLQCPLGNLDLEENRAIKEFDTLHPHGYNHIFRTLETPIMAFGTGQPGTLTREDAGKETAWRNKMRDFDVDLETAFIPAVVCDKQGAVIEKQSRRKQHMPAITEERWKDLKMKYKMY